MHALCCWRASHHHAGVVPPYRRYEPAAGRIEQDWRWAVGATPFGPYGAHDGISEIIQVCHCKARGGLYACACVVAPALAACPLLLHLVLARTHTHAHTRTHARTQNAARRNQLLAHVSAALRQLQHQLDTVDAFVSHHFQGPWDSVGLKDAHRHWLDSVAR